MKIVSWNCRIGFTKEKAKYIAKNNADIYVIQECTKKDVEELKNFTIYSKWYGDNIDSSYGIAIFSNTYQIELVEDFNKEYRYVIPFRIIKQDIIFILFAIWTKDKNIYNTKVEYTEHTWNAINNKNYEKYLLGPVIIIGDFNSNNKWDIKYKKNGKPSHNSIINKLKEYNIKSAYHYFYNEEDGNESFPTLLWKMNSNNKFHIDYCFISENFRIINVEVENIIKWENTKYSDHCALIIELK